MFNPDTRISFAAGGSVCIGVPQAVPQLISIRAPFLHVMVVPLDTHFDSSVLSNEIALDEALDALDPLRHLRGDDSLQGDGSDSRGIVPAQPRSVCNELVHLSFPDRRPTAAMHIVLKVDASPGCGGIAWPAGEVLANYLALRGKEYCTGRAVLELGSGTGLVGLVAGRLGGKVWITDQAPLLNIMQTNVKLNRLESSVVVSELNWGEARPVEIPQPDLILVADCVYFEPAFPLLAATLSELATERTEVLFCYKKRRKADKRFFILLKKNFNWKEAEDDPAREKYSREAITLLKLHRKPQSYQDF